MNAELEREAAESEASASVMGKGERKKVRSWIREQVLQSWSQDKREQADKQRQSGADSSTALLYELEREVDNTFHKKTTGEWRQVLQADDPAAQWRQHKAEAEKVAAAANESLKQVRKRVLNRLREERREEYRARGQTPPVSLEKLFPVSHNDQMLLEAALAAELDRLKSKQPLTVASVAAAPEVIDLLDDDEDEPVDSASASAAAMKAQPTVDSEKSWEEQETSARPNRRADDEAPLMDG